MIKPFHPLLNPYAKGQIDAVHFDMSRDRISLDVTSNESAKGNITFENVKAFYYVDHEAPTASDVSKAHLNTISYDTNGFGEFSAVNAEAEETVVISVPKFAVSIDDSSLFIDAKTIKIDDKSFKIR